jgi:hypothetical protein
MSDEAIGAIAISGMIGVAVTWIVCHYTFLCCKQWQATLLIRAMMERGYKPHEMIELLRVLGQRTTAAASADELPSAKPLKQPTYAANY